MAVVLKQLDSFNGDNLFIFMENAPNKFSDSLEGNLFKTVLSEHKDKIKNIWVFLTVLKTMFLWKTV